MQASLACSGPYGDPDTYRKYREFTRAHRAILRRSQETLVGYFSRRGDGQFLFDDYRTALANEESGVLNRFSTDRYCAIRESRFQDRKSVVQGKSVSVRVDLGGRRIIKKKKR